MVVSKGNNVTRFDVGDRVAFIGRPSLAEYIVLKQSVVTNFPQSQLESILTSSLFVFLLSFFFDR